VIIPGTKTTVADLLRLRDSGMAAGLERLAVQGAAFIGICGGYQMLGRRVLDPGHVETHRAEVEGLGLLPVVTRFESSKQTHQVSGTVSAGCGLLSRSVGAPIAGYEIHMGVTTVDPSGPTDTSLSGQEAVVHPFRLSRPSAGGVHHGDGSITENGWIMGTYVHGMFHNGELRRNILKSIAARKGVSLPSGGRDFSQSAEYDKLADVVRSSLDIDELYRVAGLAVK
jgi:adenosylcobyric acid synthase